MSLSGSNGWLILRHRFVAVPLALAIVTGAWNAYVAINDGGIIAGTVQDPAGRPIVGAEVLFYERSMLNYVEERRTRTDAAGAWRFDGMAVHVGQVEAIAPNGQKSERRQLRLWFKAQNTEVTPLIVREYR